jgi:hypothetical protein
VARIIELPRRAHTILMAVLLAGAAAVAAAVAGAGRWTGRDVLAFAVLAAAGAMLEQFPLPVPHGAERQLFSVTDAAWMAGLLLVRPGVLILAVAVGIAAGQTVRRVAPYKVAFNAAQYAVAVATASAVFHSFHAQGVEPRSWLLAIVAMAVYFALNAGMVAAMIAAVVGRSSSGFFGVRFDSPRSRGPATWRWESSAPWSGAVRTRRSCSCWCRWSPCMLRIGATPGSAGLTAAA